MFRLFLVVGVFISSVSGFAGVRSLAPVIAATIMAQPQPAVGEPKVLKEIPLTAGLKQQLIDESEGYLHVVNAIEFRTNRLVNVVRERFQAMVSLLPEQERTKHAEKNDKAIGTVTSIMAVDMQADTYIQNAILPLLNSMAPLLTAEKVNPKGDHIRRVLYGPNFITVLYLHYDFDEALLERAEKLDEEISRLENVDEPDASFVPFGQPAVKPADKKEAEARLAKLSEEVVKVKKALFSVPGKVMSAHRLSLVPVPEAAKKLVEADAHHHEDPKLVQDLSFQRMETEYYAPIGQPAP